MKKSAQVPASLIAALAATLPNAGCGQNGECRDINGNILPYSACQSRTVYGAHWVNVGGFGGSGGVFGG